MSATKLNLEIYQGDDWTRGFLVQFPDGIEPFDDTWSVRAQIRKNARSSIVVYEWSAANNNVEIDGSTIKLSITGAETSLFDFASAVYDLQISKDGVTKTILVGAVKLVLQVTR